MTFFWSQLRTLALAGTLALGAVAHASSDAAPGDRFEPVPEKFRNDTAGVAIDEKPGNNIPLDLQFVDTSGKHVKLGDYFNKGRPVILQMGYFRCPQICDVVSKGVMDVATKLDLELAKDYDVLYVSIDPKERWQLGQQKKANYVAGFGKPGAIEGWNFLVGSESQIKKLSDSIGFKYQYLPDRNEFSHPSMITILTPEGVVSRYLYGVDYAEPTVRLALVEASDGKVGALTDQLLMWCYHYDGYAGKYTPRWMAIMRFGGFLTVLAVGGLLGVLWLRDASRGHGKTKTDATQPSTT